MAGNVFAAGGAPLRVGVVGCGVVGGAVCRALDANPAGAELHALNDLDAGKVDAVMWELKHRPQSMTLPGVIATCDLIVEATNLQAVPQIVRLAVEGGKDILLTNAAGLVGREDFVRMAVERGTAIRLSCDILVGLDGLRAAAGGEIESATLTVTAAPSFFAAQPAGQASGADPASQGEPTQVFRGTGADALQAMPELANPIAVLCYAGRGFGETTVIGVADPAARDLACRIEVTAAEGSVSGESRIPLTAEGPRGSALVALSAVAALRRVVESLVVG